MFSRATSLQALSAKDELMSVFPKLAAAGVFSAHQLTWLLLLVSAGQILPASSYDQLAFTYSTVNTLTILLSGGIITVTARVINRAALHGDLPTVHFVRACLKFMVAISLGVSASICLIIIPFIGTASQWGISRFALFTVAVVLPFSVFERWFRYTWAALQIDYGLVAAAAGGVLGAFFVFVAAITLDMSRGDLLVPIIVSCQIAPALCLCYLNRENLFGLRVTATPLPVIQSLGQVIPATFSVFLPSMGLYLLVTSAMLSAEEGELGKVVFYIQAYGLMVFAPNATLRMMLPSMAEAWFAAEEHRKQKLRIIAAMFVHAIKIGSCALVIGGSALALLGSIVGGAGSVSLGELQWLLLAASINIFGQPLAMGLQVVGKLWSNLGINFLWFLAIGGGVLSFEFESTIGLVKLLTFANLLAFFLTFFQLTGYLKD